MYAFLLEILRGLEERGRVLDIEPGLKDVFAGPLEPFHPVHVRGDEELDGLSGTRRGGGQEEAELAFAGSSME